MKIPYEASLPFYHLIWNYWRKKLWNEFSELVKPSPEDRVLDVGNWEDQLKFALEARHVGKRLWIQTPTFGCPVEPHFLGLFIHWFPRSLYIPLARWTSEVGLTGAADLMSISSSTRLPTKKNTASNSRILRFGPSVYF